MNTYAELIGAARLAAERGDNALAQLYAMQAGYQRTGNAQLHGGLDVSAIALQDVEQARRRWPWVDRTDVEAPAAGASPFTARVDAEIGRLAVELLHLPARPGVTADQLRSYKKALGDEMQRLRDLLDHDARTGHLGTTVKCAEFMTPGKGALPAWRSQQFRRACLTWAGGMAKALKGLAINADRIKPGAGEVSRALLQEVVTATRENREAIEKPIEETVRKFKKGSKKGAGLALGGLILLGLWSATQGGSRRR